MIVSATFMLFIIKGIDSVRSGSATIGPGGFNSIIQLDHGMDTYADALEKYRASIGNSDEQLHWTKEVQSDIQPDNGVDTYADALEKYRTNIGNPDEQFHWTKDYQSEFNILWGNLEYFTLRSLDNGPTDSLRLKFKHDAQQFLANTEPAMAQDQELGADQITTILNDLSVLRDQLHVLGREYFHGSLIYRDTWVKNLSNLHKLLLFFSAVLITTACLLVAFLIRSNHKKNMLIREADDVRGALSSTVEELRSGRLEQRAKDSFIAAASHDLRQPLHALGLYLGSLDKHISDKKGRATLNEAIECSANLGSLFNSLLDLSRLDAGIVKVELEHFRLQNLISMLQNEYQAKTSQSAINVDVHVQNAVVKSDPILLSRIIRNLIENALIHSGADTITVKCSKKNNVVQLQVQDNGVGISHAEQQRVFTEYYQINDRSTGAGKGLGLGLSIVKRLADLLDMRITLRSEVGIYTAFTMDISAGDERQVVPSQITTSAIPDQLKNEAAIIAVIDNDEKICTAMATMLQSLGLRAITATSADDMIDNLIESDTTPSLIVADYRLHKGKTGDQAIVQLRRALNLDAPGLLITADTAPNIVADAARSGFELLHKPVQPAELSDKIRKILADQYQESAPVKNKPSITLVN